MFENHAGTFAWASLFVMMFSIVSGMVIFFPEEVNPYIFASLCIFNLSYSSLMLCYWTDKYKEVQYVKAGYKLVNRPDYGKEQDDSELFDQTNRN